jgi:hypothetical protein
MFCIELGLRAAARSCLPHFLLITLSSVWALSASAAPKTDIVYFKNGDKLTGEVKSLRRGRLSLNTDATGTITIEWDKIAGIVSNQDIQVETASGIRYFGHLATSKEDSEIVVVTGNGPQALDAERVIVMEPIEGRGIHALDIDLSVGYNFTKAGGVTQGNLGINVDYRGQIRIESLRFNTTISDSDTLEASRRLNLGLQHTRLWNNRWFSTGSLTFDQNDELDLDLRTSFGSSVGRFLIQSNRMLWSLDAGLQVSREDLTTGDEDTDSVEATFSANWDWFLFQDPELDWSTTLQLIPSLTESGRVRGEIDTDLKWELINDLKWGITFYASFDNQPQTVTGSTSDYGVNTTLTYEF